MFTSSIMIYCAIDKLMLSGIEKKRSVIHIKDEVINEMRKICSLE
jgi:hypothetical protein